MEMSGKTKIDELLKKYPFLLDFFIKLSPKFKMLQSAVMRKTVGKVAPLSQIAGKGGISLELLLTEVAAEIRAQTGQEVTISHEPPEDESET